ncbi:MAG: carboxypeptidase regulatory-like domain-containing protein [Candidatus Tyrphobacter sp.]
MSLALNRHARYGTALLAVLLLWPLAARAQAPATGTIGGTVTAQGVAVAGASVDAIGPVRQHTTTDAHGAYTLNLPPGIYEIVFSKAGFYQSSTNVAIVSGTAVTANVALQAQSFSSLSTIAHVSTNEPGRAQINESTAAVNIIPGSVFLDQGSTQVTQVLNETPGIFTSPYYPVNGNPTNGASPAAPQTPQIRGALPYETESLIDGHPVSVGASGYYSPNILNPFLLQDVELVKGPGSMPEEINYAINGTVNYRTLDPTLADHESAMFMDDRWGGVSTGFRATGTTMDHRLGYAFGYVTHGAPGPLENFRFDASQLPLDTGPVGGPYDINGQQIAMPLSVVGYGVPPSKFAPYDGMGLVFAEPLVGCCDSIDTGYHSDSELGKLVFNFSSNTSLRISYLGGQSENGNGDPAAYSVADVDNTGLPGSSFEPCGTAGAPINCNPRATGTSYNCASTGGGPACGTAIPFDVSSVNGLGNTWTQQNLFQGEFRTTFGNGGTVLARYYSGSLDDYVIQGALSGAPLSYTMRTYGTIPLCPIGTRYDAGTLMCAPAAGPEVAPVNTTFTGQNATFSTGNEANLFDTRDTMSGETFEGIEQFGTSTFTLAYDRSEQGSSETADEPSVGIIVHSPVAGSSQTFQTLSLRGYISLTSKVQLNVSDYDINYLSHYSITGGKSWNDSSHTYNEPRAALTWQLNPDTVFRFSTGGSVAPPYITLISSGGPTWSQIIGGVPAAGWIQDANNGDIDAETAWGEDVGVDHRIHGATSVSVDAYFTQLHNMFLTQTSVVSGAAAAGCPNQPCELSETANLGQARYEGIELALKHVPEFGFGWDVQGSLQRAFTYNLPPYFYCAGSTSPLGVTTPPGPGCVYNTNLAVLPDVNFGGQPTAFAGSPNGIGSARVPYALGYGALTWTGHFGQYYNLGAQYFGNNNSFDEPPFFVLSANAGFNVSDHGTRLQISADNLTGAYDNPYVGFFNGIPLPLVKGATQTNPLTGATGPAYLALTPGGNYGPLSLRIQLIQSF